SWCIQYPQLELAQSYELKSRLIHLLPKFHNLVCEDPYKHLKEFHVVCSTMRPEGLVVSTADYVQHMGRHEADVPRKVLPGIQDNGHLKGDLWNPTTLKGNIAWVLGKVQQVVYHVSASPN
ncbi:hypothetical protein CR513_17696, partial [Mucuna pruriens]